MTFQLVWGRGVGTVWTLSVCVGGYLLVTLRIILERREIKEQELDLGTQPNWTAIWMHCTHYSEIGL